MYVNQTNVQRVMPVDVSQLTIMTMPSLWKSSGFAQFVMPKNIWTETPC
jgi:hypothetical protein